jgi:hypothetical protein
VEALLLDEIGRLSERYRVPLLLCCLDGKSRDEAAAQLRIAAGTLKMRLERARKLLRVRLARRGLALSAGLLSLRLARAGARETVPAALVAAAVRAGTGPAGTVPERIWVLSRGAAGAAAVSRLALGALAVVCTLAAGWGFTSSRRPDPPAAAASTDEPHADPGAKAGPKVRVDADGDPLPAEALSRLGSLRLRHGPGGSFVALRRTGRRSSREARTASATGMLPRGGRLTPSGFRRRDTGTPRGLLCPGTASPMSR